MTKLNNKKTCPENRHALFAVGLFAVSMLLIFRSAHSVTINMVQSGTASSIGEKARGEKAREELA